MKKSFGGKNDGNVGDESELYYNDDGYVCYLIRRAKQVLAFKSKCKDIEEFKKKRRDTSKPKPVLKMCPVKQQFLARADPKEGDRSPDFVIDGPHPAAQCPRGAGRVRLVSHCPSGMIPSWSWSKASTSDLTKNKTIAYFTSNIEY